MTVYSGTAAGDYLTAYSDGDVLMGLAGDDVFSTNGAWFRAEGGLGNDLFYVLSTGTTVVEAAGQGTDSVRLYGVVSYVLPENVEHLVFSDEIGRSGTGNALDNELTGNAAANRLYGLGGDDRLLGGGGGDRLEGGEGQDFLDAGGGAATLVTGAGRDVVYVNRDVVEASYTVTDFNPLEDQLQIRGFGSYTLTQQGADTLVTFSSYVTVLLRGVAPGQLGAGNFDMPPPADAHTYVGTDGTESLYGWADGDTLYGLAGDDYFGDHDGDWSRFHGGRGNDSFEVDNAADQVFELAREGTDVVWLYIGGTYTLPDHVENVNVMGAATLVGNREDNSIQGSGGDDVLLGGAGDDTIRGNFGSDRIEGGDGNDLLDGGGGDSVILTGAGSDRVSMNQDSGNHVVEDFSVAGDSLEVWDFTRFERLEQIGDDTLAVFRSASEASLSTSVLLAGVALADLHSGSFTFHQLGTAGGERLAGGRYQDSIAAGGGNDTLLGQAGTDTLSGGAGIDRVEGGSGADILRGNGGGDTLYGGGGRDLLTGGSGADRYLYRAATESRVADPDRIYGFSASGGDLVDLSAIDADSGASGDQAFAFAAAFTGQAGQATLSYDAARNTTLFLGDANGDGVADFALLFAGSVGTEAGWVF